MLRRRSSPYKKFEDDKRILCFEKRTLPKGAKPTLVCKVNKKTKKVFWLTMLTQSAKWHYSLHFGITDYWVSPRAQTAHTGRLIADVADIAENIAKNMQRHNRGSDEIYRTIYSRQRKIFKKAGINNAHQAILGTKSARIAEHFYRLGANRAIAKVIRTMIERYGIDLADEYFKKDFHYELGFIRKENLRRILSLAQPGAASWEIRDIDSIYGVIIARNASYKMPKTKSLDELHDKLNEDYGLMRAENVKIPWNEKQQERFCASIDGYDFYLPVDTHTLVRIGSKLRNCVGSYAEAVLAGKRIVIVGNQGDEPRICIEAINSEVRQCLGPCNRSVTDKERKIVRKYFKQVRLQFRSETIMYGGYG